MKKGTDFNILLLTKFKFRKKLFVKKSHFQYANYIIFYIYFFRKISHYQSLQLNLLTGAQLVMPCEPKKYSRPNTTTAVCQIPSIWRPGKLRKKNRETFGESCVWEHVWGFCVVLTAVSKRTVWVVTLVGRRRKKKFPCCLNGTWTESSVTVLLVNMFVTKMRQTQILLFKQPCFYLSTLNNFIFVRFYVCFMSQ